MINGTLLRNKTRVYNLLYTTIYKFIFWSSIIFFISVACLFYLLFFYYLSLALAAAVFTISTLLFNVTCTHFRAQKHFNKFALFLLIKTILTILILTFSMEGITVEKTLFIETFSCIILSIFGLKYIGFIAENRVDFFKLGNDVSRALRYSGAIIVRSGANSLDRGLIMILAVVLWQANTLYIWHYME